MNRPYKRMLFIFVPATLIVTMIAVWGQSTYNVGTLQLIWKITILLLATCLFGEYVWPKLELAGQNSVIMTIVSMLVDGLLFLIVFGAGLIGLTVLYLSALSFT